jgi:RimJ/RimL family protein N-acetyltransferase
MTMPINLVRLDPVDDDHEALVDFMTRNEFIFHGNPRLAVEAVESAIADGVYRSEDNDSFWVDHVAHGRIGFLRLEDLRDPTPMFDLRLDEGFRGRGLGIDAVQAATQHVFTTLPDVHRFEGQTREDNIAMRKTFLRCGWVKEAHYREGWPVEGGRPVASVAYSILRRDWETGRATTFVWEDLSI